MRWRTSGLIKVLELRNGFRAEQGLCKQRRAIESQREPEGAKGSQREPESEPERARMSQREPERAG